MSHKKTNIFTSPLIVFLLFFFKHIISQGTNVSGGWYSGNLSSQIVGFISCKRWIAYNLLSKNKESFHWSLNPTPLLLHLAWLTHNNNIIMVHENLAWNKLIKGHLNFHHKRKQSQKNRSGHSTGNISPPMLCGQFMALQYWRVVKQGLNWYIQEDLKV